MAMQCRELNKPGGWCESMNQTLLHPAGYHCYARYWVTTSQNSDGGSSSTSHMAIVIMKYDPEAIAQQQAMQQGLQAMMQMAAMGGAPMMQHQTNMMLATQLQTNMMAAMMQQQATQGPVAAQASLKVQVPMGVGPGQTFQVNVNGRLVQVQCPATATAGQTIQILATGPAEIAQTAMPVALPVAGNNSAAAVYPVATMPTEAIPVALAAESTAAASART